MLRHLPRFGVVLTLVACGIGSALAADAELDKAGALFQEGVQLGAGKKFAEARAKYEQSAQLYRSVSERDPANTVANKNADSAAKNVLWTYAADSQEKLGLADQLLKQSKYAEASAAFSEAVKAYEVAKVKDPAGAGRYENNLKFAREKARTSKGLGAIAGKEAAPAFALPDLDGRTVQLADYRGKPVLVVFWAVWCPVCQGFLPTIEESYRKHKADGLHVVGLDVDKTTGFGKGGTERVAAYAKEKLSFPVLWATDDLLRDFGGIGGVPSVFLIDSAGKFYRKYDSSSEAKDAIEADIAKLLVK